MVNKTIAIPAPELVEAARAIPVAELIKAINEIVVPPVDGIVQLDVSAVAIAVPKLDMALDVIRPELKQ